MYGFYILVDRDLLGRQESQVERAGIMLLLKCALVPRSRTTSLERVTVT